MTFGRWFAAAVAAAVLLATLGLAPGAVRAQKSNKTKADGGVGYVDLNLVTDEVKKTPEWKATLAKYESENQRLRGEFDRLTLLRYLTAAERQQLETLKAKPKPTDAEDAQIKALERKSDEIDREYQALARLDKLAPEQQTRLNQLTELRQKAIGELQSESEKRGDALQQAQVQAVDAMQKRILEYVKQIADNRGMSLVLDRTMVLYGGDDLTSDVLKKLGAK